MPKFAATELEVNLFDLLTEDAQGRRIPAKQTALAQSSRWPCQEIEFKASAEGWTIIVYSTRLGCVESAHLFIPSDKSRPITADIDDTPIADCREYSANV